MACIVPGCSSRAGAVKNIGLISFHRFPNDVDLRRTWIKNVRRGDNWSPSPYTRICSLHFENSCFRDGYGRKTLHSYAVPTIFPNHPISCQQKLAKKRKLTHKYGKVGASTSSAANIELNGSPSKANRAVQTEDVNGTFIDAVLRKAMKLINKYKKLAAIRGKNLKNLQRNYSRLTKKNRDLKIIIEALNEEADNNSVNDNKLIID